MAKRSGDFDRDHVFWREKDWTSSKEATMLCTMGSMIIRLDRMTHQAKHDETPPVPLLDFHTLRAIPGLYEPGRTPLESVDNMQLAIMEAAKNPRAHDIQKHLADLAIWAIDLGKPYWQQSPDQPRATIIDLGEYRARREIG